jgi:hypothetical protein
MQMTQLTSPSGQLPKVLLTFFIGGVGSGLLFTWFVTRTVLNNFWFRRQGFWVLPTWKFGLLAGGLFLLGLAGAYALCHCKRWLSFPTYRPITAVLLLAAVAFPFWWLMQLPSLVQFFLVRITLALFLSLALFLVTRQWHSGVAALILVVCMIVSLLASIPDAFVQSFANEWFESLKFVIASSLLSILSGYWLAKSSPTNATPR